MRKPRTPRFRPPRAAGRRCPAPTALRRAAARPRRAPRPLPLCLVVLLALPAAPAVHAQRTTTPGALEEVGLEQRIGESVPLELPLVDHTGAAVELGDLLGGRPVVLAPVYYECPMLCGMVLDGLARSLGVLAFDAGTEFDVVAVSIDPAETPAQAAASRSEQLGRYGRPGAEAGFHFLTGSAEAVTALTDAIGFGYAWDERSEQYAHAATVLVLTPEGRIARYFPGVEYPPRDLRLALIEAADGRLGNAVDRVLLYCFQYDPATGRYTLMTMNLVRLGGLLTLAAVGAFVVLSLRRERRRQAEARA